MSGRKIQVRHDRTAFVASGIEAKHVEAKGGVVRKTGRRSGFVKQPRLRLPDASAHEPSMVWGGSKRTNGSSSTIRDMVKGFVKQVDSDPFIVDLFKPVAQVAVHRVYDSVGKGGRREAVGKIVEGARNGTLRVRGMAHPVNGELVREVRELDEIGVQLMSRRPFLAEAKVTEDPVADVYFVQPEKSVAGQPDTVRPYGGAAKGYAGSPSSGTIFDALHARKDGEHLAAEALGLETGEPQSTVRQWRHKEKPCHGKHAPRPGA